MLFTGVIVLLAVEGGVEIAGSVVWVPGSDTFTVILSRLLRIDGADYARVICTPLDSEARMADCFDGRAMTCFAEGVDSGDEPVPDLRPRPIVRATVLVDPVRTAAELTGHFRYNCPGVELDVAGECYVFGDGGIHLRACGSGGGPVVLDGNAAAVLVAALNLMQIVA